MGEVLTSSDWLAGSQELGLENTGWGEFTFRHVQC